MDCIDTNIFTIDEIIILETMKNNYNKFKEGLFISQEYTVEKYDICDFLDESNINKIHQIFSYLSNDTYDTEDNTINCFETKIVYCLTYKYINIIFEQRYHYKNELIIRYYGYKTNMDDVENIKKIFGFLLI